MSKCAPDIKDASLIQEKTEEVQQGNKKQVVEKELQNPENERLDGEKKINTGTLTKTETNDDKESSTSSSDTDSKLIICKESVENSDSKLEENVVCGETNSLESLEVSKQQEDACLSKTPLSKDVKKQNKKTKTKPKKKLLSPSSNSEKNALSKFVTLNVEKNSNINGVTNGKEQTEGSKTKNLEPEEKDLGCNTSSASGENSPERVCLSSADDSLFKTPTMMVNNSLSAESESNTTPSTPDTPTSSKKSASKTPRKMTPNQLKKLKEKEEQRIEKERLKQVCSAFL